MTSQAVAGAILVYLSRCIITCESMQTHSKTVVSANTYMDSSKNTTNLKHPNVSQDLLASIPLSEYAKKLYSVVKRRYLEKIECVGIDPALIQGKNFDPDCLPPTNQQICHLVLETSYYTKEQFKNYRSLKAFNQLIGGFITSVQGHKISNKKSTHRSFIFGAHCSGCKAGLAESCSHFACVLYYLESWTKINGKLACTQIKCQWILPPFVKDVEYEISISNLQRNCCLNWGGFPEAFLTLRRSQVIP